MTSLDKPVKSMRCGLIPLLESDKTGIDITMQDIDEDHGGEEYDPEDDGGSSCYCKQRLPTKFSFIGCENEACPIGWFHIKCVNIDETVSHNSSYFSLSLWISEYFYVTVLEYKRMMKDDKNWFCPECTKTQQQKVKDKLKNVTTL
jgi:hypothetical protein